MNMRAIGLCAVIAVTCAIGACSTTAPETGAAALAEKTKEAANKTAAVEFYQALIGDSDYVKAETYVGAYIQHDPNIDGESA